MTVVAFDCCLRAVSVTVLRGGIATTRREAAETGGQAERLIPLIEEARMAASVAWSEVERIAVTLGPGGFTGVRVGIAAARAFALALRVPAVGLSSLDLLAMTAREHALLAPAERLLVVVPAGKGGVYAQNFDAQARPTSVARVVEADALAALGGETDVIGGPGASLVGAARAAAGLAPPRTLDGLEASTECLARAALDLTVPTELRPIYLRAADAKPQQGKGLQRA